MDLHFSYLIESLHDPSELDDAQLDQFVKCCGMVDHFEPEEVAELLRAMQQHCMVHRPPRPALLDPLLGRLTSQRHPEQRHPEQRHPEMAAPLSDELRPLIATLYGGMGDVSCKWRLLQWLAKSRQEADLQVLVECVIESPPQDPQAAALALTPLFQARDYDPQLLFPRLFAAIQHLSIAAPVLDLANYLMRSGMVDRHLATRRGAELAVLLGRLVQQLGCIEEQPAATNESPVDLGKKVDECVALVVALCDTLALIGETCATGKLYQAMELRHRRIRTAAAAALAQLGEEAGVAELARLAAEPVARLRVIAHAEELDVVENIDEKYRTEEARAEAQVALELAQPPYFGVPPSSLELIESRIQFWPSYDEPVACYLFRYEYRFDDALYSNVAIAGPLVHAIAADLSDLPPNDIYAAYAGWQVDDESVFEIPLDAPTMEQRSEAERFERRLRNNDYESIHSLLLGYFFGDRSLIARASLHGVVGMAVVDQDGIDWLPIRTQKYPLGAHEAFCIYKGRRLLRSFNG